MRNLFFPHYLNRLAFLIRFVVMMGLIVAIVMWAVYEHASPDRWLIAIAAGLLLITYGACCVFLPRLRDIGLPLWTFVLTFVPGVNVVYSLMLLLMPSRVRQAREEGATVASW